MLSICYRRFLERAMGHTKPEMITDLARELEAIRSLDRLTERSPGCFYYKSAGFLHFHDKDGRRWADVKTPTGYEEIEIGFSANAADRRRFVKAVERAHSLLAGAKARKLRP
jgi:hypothetical protein